MKFSRRAIRRDKMRRSVWVFVVALVLGCSEAGDFAVERYPTGEILREYRLIKGKKNGKEVEYFPDHTVKSVSYYKNDSLNGIKETFYKNGKLSSRVGFQNGLIHGDFLTFFRNGSIDRSGHFKKGLRYGHFYKYYASDSGRIKLDTYMVIVDKDEYEYYSKLYDEQGVLIGNERTLDVSLDRVPDKRTQFLVNIHCVDSATYDSMKIVVGKFEDLNAKGVKKLDTVRFENNRASFMVDAHALDDSTVRGTFLAYSQFVKEDTLVKETLVKFFEERIPQ
jgi:antirestriction protein ArdC